MLKKTIISLLIASALVAVAPSQAAASYDGRYATYLALNAATNYAGYRAYQAAPYNVYGYGTYTNTYRPTYSYAPYNYYQAYRPVYNTCGYCGAAIYPTYGYGYGAYSYDPGYASRAITYNYMSAMAAQSAYLKYAYPSYPRIRTNTTPYIYNGLTGSATYNGIGNSSAYTPSYNGASSQLDYTYNGTTTGSVYNGTSGSYSYNGTSSDYNYNGSSTDYSYNGTSTGYAYNGTTGGDYSFNGVTK